LSDDRHSIAELPELIDDPDEKARQEAENGVRQFNLAVEIIREHVQDPERPFRLRPRYLVQLNAEALKGIHSMAGTYRNGPIRIGKSRHTPPEAFMVAEEVAGMCDYVNNNWQNKDGLHLSAYVLWRLNWIHPFADGWSNCSHYIIRRSLHAARWAAARRSNHSGSNRGRQAAVLRGSRSSR
jgi:Fic family protein